MRIRTRLNSRFKITDLGKLSWFFGNVTPSKQNYQNITTPNSENISPTKDIDNNVRKAPPKIQVDVEDLLQRAKVISSGMKEHGLMFNLEKVKQDQKKRTVYVFVVDKRLLKIVKPHKDMVVCQLTSLGVKVLAVIAGTSYDFWDVMSLTAEGAVALPRKPLENKDYIFRTEHMRRW